MAREPNLTETADEAARDAGEAVESAARKAADAGREALGVAAESLGAAASEVGAAAARARDRAVAEAESRAEAGKDRLAEEGHRFAERLRARAQDDDEPVRRRILDMMAGSVSDLSDDLSGQSLSSILSETERFARRNPGAFVAGAAVLGFALARFARAGAPPPARKSRSGAASGGKGRA